MYKHNFSNVTATWAGIDIKAGLDVGLSIAVARTTARNTFKPTGSGKLIKIRQTDESGTLTATIDYSSPTHGLLMAQLELETVSVFTLYDGNTGRRWFYKNATLITEPDLALGVDTGPFAWAWMFESSTFQPGDPGAVMEPTRARKIGEVVFVSDASESTRVQRDHVGMLDLLALRIITKVHTPTLVEIRQLREAGYRGWARGDERRLLCGQPLGDGWELVDVATFGAETWQVERDGVLLQGEYSERADAIAGAWADAARLCGVVGPQMLAAMMRPPEGYAVVLVAGVSQRGSRLGPWSEVRS